MMCVEKGQLDFERELEELEYNNVEMHILVKGFTSMLNTLNTMIEKAKKVTFSVYDYTHSLQEMAQDTSLSAAEGDKGFAVVTDEVRKFSVQTESAISSIATILQTIDEKKRSTLEQLALALEVFNKQLPMVNGVTEIFIDIDAKMKEVDDSLNDTHYIISQVVEEKETVEKKMKYIAQIVEEAVSVTEEVSVEIIEQIEASKSMTQLANVLSLTVEQLEVSYKISE